MGTTSGKEEMTVMQSQVLGASKRFVGAGEEGEEDEEKVGVGSECNATPSSDWLIPLSHVSICKHVGIVAEDIAAKVSKFAVVTCKVKSTDVMPPTAEAGLKGVAPPFIRVQWVCLPCAFGAPGDLLPTLLVPAPVTLVWEVAVLLDIVVPPAGITGAKTALFRRLRGRIG